MTDTNDDKVMRSFDTGATRDTAEGKLDMEGFTHPMVMKQFAKYMNMNRLQSDGKLRDSDNWQKGIPLNAYMKSLRRHHDDMWLEHRGFPSESGMIAALCGILFNAHGYLLEFLKERDFNLQDFDGDQPTPEMKKRQGAQTHTIDQCQDEQCDGTCELTFCGSTKEDGVHGPGMPLLLTYNKEAAQNLPDDATTPEETMLLGHTGFCMSEYARGVCNDCPTEQECLDMAAREDAEAQYEKSKQDFLDATMLPVQPVIEAMNAWLDEMNEELLDVPELPVCFGDCSIEHCAGCADDDECNTHLCAECDFIVECDEAIEDDGEDEPPKCHNCMSVHKSYFEWPCKECAVNLLVVGNKCSYFVTRR